MGRAVDVSSMFLSAFHHRPYAGIEVISFPLYSPTANIVTCLTGKAQVSLITLAMAQHAEYQGLTQEHLRPISAHSTFHYSPLASRRSPHSLRVIKA